MKKTILLCGLLALSLANAEDAAISVRDLDTKVKLIGLLGRPLGEIVEIECRGIPEPADNKTKLPYWKNSVTVVAIQGKPVDEPFIVPFVSFTTGEVGLPKPGVSKKFFGYETGEYSGYPKDLFEYVPPMAGVEFAFRTTFVALKESE